MQITSCLLSLLLHMGILMLGLYFPWQGAGQPIDLGLPVYEVELVRAPAPEPEEPDQIQQQAPALEEKPPEDSGPKAARMQARAPQAESKPKPVQLQKKESTQPRSAPEPKAKQQPEQQEKPAAQQTSQPRPTREDVLSRTLQEVRQHAQNQAESDQEVLQRELAELRAAAQEREGATQGSMTGTSRRQEIYALQVQQRIKESWRFPSLGSDQDLKAEVQIRINAQGEITEVNMLRRSGRADFDSSILRAVEEAEGLPSPPDEQLSSIRITFHASELER